MRMTDHEPTPSVHDIPPVRHGATPPPDPSSADGATRNPGGASDMGERSLQAHDIHRARAVAQAAPEVRVARVEAARRALQEGPSRWTGRPWRRSSLRRSVRSAGTPERGDAVGPTWVSEWRQPRSRPPFFPRQVLSSAPPGCFPASQVPCCCHCASAACACSQRS